MKWTINRGGPVITIVSHQLKRAVKVTIRPMEPPDIEPVASVPNPFVGFIESGFRYHVAEVDGELVGFVGVRDNKHLYHLFVANPMQRRGIGRALWEVAKREAAANGHGGAFTVNSSNNALPIYERWGFRRDGPAKNSNGVVYNPMRLETDG